MKKLIVCVISICLLFSLVACSEERTNSTPEIPFDGMLDNDTGEIYRLGDKKEKFDSAFGASEYDEKYDCYYYLSEILEIEFDENECASSIASSGKSDRFAFYNFTFDTPIEKIEGRYEKSDVTTGYIFYTKYFTSQGDPSDLYNSYVIARLMVRDGDLLDMKDGEYISYIISLK